MKRKILTALLAVTIIMFTLTACTATSSTAVMCVENCMDNKWTISYKSLNGEKGRSISVPDGSKCLVSGNITTESGTIYVTVIDSSENVCYTSDKYSGNGSFEYMIEEGGKYSVILNADHHYGSAEIEWDVIGGQKS